MSVTPSTRSFSSVRQLSGTTLGRWQVGSVIGEGRWMRVFRARPIRSPSPSYDYAVKVPRSTSDPIVLELLKREFEVARGVSHPHLVSVLAAHWEQAAGYLVMPYYHGATLQQTIVQHAPLSALQAVWILRQTAQAVLALHDHGWLHADLKPSNILVAPSGHVTLLDLGFARRRNTDECHPNSPWMGTLAYAAPERFSGLSSIDTPSDVYSLGCTLYQALTGNVPFPQTTTDQLVQAQRQQPAPDPRRVNPLAPRDTSHLVRRMLAKDPLRRPDLAEVIDRLTRLEIDLFEERIPG